MTDNELFRALLPLVRTGVASLGVADVTVKQQYQPTQQGTPSGLVLFLHKISDVRYGFPERKSVWDQSAGDFLHTESVWMQTSFQVNALAPQDPKHPELPTASDLLNLAAWVLQSDAARQALQSHEVGIYRVQDIRQVYFVDDTDRFEASPSFDFTLTHRRTITSRAPAVQTFEHAIYRV
ncbi:hypothetical protein LMG10661_03454 [Ralstonia syzygii subsp. syzygii]|nr:hypothetical protein LMG10661_03454 [Ralstonia syzygii subsp. syzygii]